MLGLLNTAIPELLHPATAVTKDHHAVPNSTVLIVKHRRETGVVHSKLVTVCVVNFSPLYQAVPFLSLSYCVIVCVRHLSHSVTLSDQ
ncbi:hypothetical protein RRG08_052092 [Elysia crispata]|uniref:Uncharacterized protein n=1 Tax=Elysia crispata TaxID=231223 RepID=A0AAE1A5Q4_9GAST|nr:hypothetical protein RRG08_052092 [Elysia crispata]